MSVELEKDEHLIFEIRKHWYVLLTHGLMALVLFMLPLIIYAAIGAMPIRLEIGNDTVSFLLFVYFGILLIVWMFIFYWWTDYYLDVWIITDKRIIAIEQHGLFGREVKTLTHARIQDITSEVHGINATLLKFGDITVDNASAHGVFTIKRVANPNEVRTRLNDVLTDYQDKHYVQYGV